MRSTPALVLLCAIAFLHEEVTSIGVLGIILVTLGTYLINMTHFDLRSFFAPIKSLFSDKSTQFALLAMLFATGYSIIDKMAVTYMHPVVFTYLLTTACVVFYTPYVFSTKSPQVFQEEWRTNLRAIIINSIIDQGGYFLIIYTFTFENVSYTTGLRQLSTVFAVIMGNHFLKEKNMYIRLCATVVILIGSLFIAIA